MSSTEAPMKRKLGSTEKTPVTVLQELCVQENELVVFEYVPHETDSTMFSCLVAAFDLVSSGSGRSKKEAKHEASEHLMAQLAKMDRFKQKLQKVPETPRPISDSDAIAVLLEICVQRNFPMPTFELMQSGGEPHPPMFTYVCQVSKIKRTGTFSTKKGARQIAAREVLEIVQNCVQNEEKKLIATIDAEPPEKVFRAYRELKEIPAKPKAHRLRDRHNFFLRLPEADRNAAKKILMDDFSVIYGTAKDRVGLVCSALKHEYKVIDIPNHRQQFKAFYLLDDYDCLITAKEEDLYDRVIAYLKTMLDLQ
ncbi:uncharacterized protein LOC129577455 [Sitodiplosis mosellana]|uniref:uncharacterized protein LOC129577455 n=1 Tax=Sitodiplosis mosellana TaxID=263140 RepID=UPI002443752D|nr:uncharacterized protein LOC129577455 [Sitodiplosis mosellana]